MKKVVIDASACNGQKYCKRFAPEVFDLDEWGYGKVIKEEIPDELVPGAEAAVEACPMQAIKLL